MKQICKKRDAAYKKMVTHPNDETKAKFKKLRNEAKKLIMTEKRKFYDNQLGNCNDSKKKYFKFSITFVGKRNPIRAVQR